MTQSQDNPHSTTRQALAWTRLRLIVALWVGLIIGATDPHTALAALDDLDLSQLTIGQDWRQQLGLAEDTQLSMDVTAPPAIQDVLLDVCQQRGYGVTCAQDLLGMAWKESNFKGNAIGDKGLALGFFQIHYRMHRVSPTCARDLRCSAEWSLTYLEQNGYAQRRQQAVQCHNGCGVANGYAASAMRHGQRLWSSQLAMIETAVTTAQSASRTSGYQAAMVAIK